MVAVAATPLRPVQVPRTSMVDLIAWGVLLATLAGSWKGADMRPWALVSDASNMATYAADFFPPRFGDWRIYLQ